MTILIQIEMVALEEASFLLSEKPKCPLINPIADDISTPVNQPPRCAPWNLFGNGTFSLVYKPLDLDAWPKSRTRKKVCRPDIFKLSILQENKWEVVRTFEATLLIPSNIPPS
jgi:hypothetical protein